MEFGLLGPLLVRDGSRTVRLPPRQRVLLAALLLRSRQVIATDELAAAVWNGQPPPGARGAMHTAVRRLRSGLGPAAGSLIRTSSPGYVIEVGDDELDIRRFAVLAAGGRGAAGAGQWARAAADFHAALGLWRGEPLADIPSPLLRSRELPHLEEQRLEVLAARIDADLHLGNPGAVIAELRRLVTAHPLREGFHAQLMLALYRSGRQADALAAYQDVRRLLAEEVGADPGTDLQDLHQRILYGDPGLLLATAGPGKRPDPAKRPDLGQRPGVAVPRQLPAGVRHFAGRAAELAALTGLVEETAEPGGTVVISAIDGTAGIGKTALAVHFAHLVADRFPDGQLYIDLGGFGPAATPVQPAEAIRGFLDAFGMDPRRIPDSTGAQASLYRSLLAGKRILILLDNARDAAQVRLLLPGSLGCLVLVTSRSALTPLVAAEDAYPLTLDLLPAGEARDLLARRLGTRRTSASPRVADELIELCARLPLALSITAARIAGRPGMPLAAIAAELRDARDRLGALDAGDAVTSIRAVFSWSYDLLSEHAARMFRLLSLHPGASISAAAAASVTALPAEEARQVLRELRQAHLIAESFPGRYSCHDLLRAYAAERSTTGDSAAERQTATLRMLDYYLYTAHAAALLLTPARRPLTLPSAQDGTVPDALVDPEQAVAWFEAEYRNALAVAERAADMGYDAHAWQIPWALSRFFDRRGLWREWAVSERVALAAAQRQRDPAGEAATYHELGYALMRLGEYSQADACLHRSAEMHEKLGDQGQQARVNFTLAMACEIQGRPDDALSYAQRALMLARAAGDRAFQPYPLNGVGYFQAQLGNYQQTITCCHEAITLHQECGNPYGEADTWDSLGYAYYHLGRHAEAIDCYTRALGMYRRFGDLWSTVTALDHLGDTRKAGGDPSGARDAWEQALSILDDLRHDRADEVRSKLSSLGH